MGKRVRMLDTAPLTTNDRRERSLVSLRDLPSGESILVLLPKFRIFIR